MGTDGSFLGVKRPEREADHSPPYSAEIKECVELYLHSRNVFMAWCLVKHRDNLTFCLYFLVARTKVKYRSPALETNLSQFNPPPILTFYIANTHLN
jgi:hypothetical protein